MLDLKLTAINCYAEPNDNKSITVEVNGADEGEILGQIDIGDAVSHYGGNELLEQIGVDTAKDYFDLKDNE